MTNKSEQRDRSGLRVNDHTAAQASDVLTALQAQLTPEQLEQLKTAVNGELDASGSQHEVVYGFLSKGVQASRLHLTRLLSNLQDMGAEVALSICLKDIAANRDEITSAVTGQRPRTAERRLTETDMVAQSFLAELEGGQEAVGPTTRERSTRRVGAQTMAAAQDVEIIQVDQEV